MDISGSIQGAFGKEQAEQMQIIHSLSRIYTSVYYIDLAKNFFKELSSLSDVHTHIGATGDAQERLNYFCRNMMLSDFTDELLAFVDLSTLEQRLGGSRIISKQYQSNLFVSPETGRRESWAQCSFIEGDRDASGRLSHVIFVTQSIHDAKVKELDAQRKLQKANAELTALLAAEKQHTAIIGSLSSVFFALYYIDLEQNTYQQMISPDSAHHTYGQKGDAKALLKNEVAGSASDAYRSVMRIFTNIHTLDERLGSQPIITQEFVTVSGTWVRCSFFPVERSADGRNLKVICGLRNITNEKETVATQDNLILALSMSYENVYAVNVDTGEAVCYRMGQTMSDRYGQKFAAGNYEQNIRLYVEHDVLAEDWHLFDQVCSLAGVGALLSDRQSYYFNYRVHRNDQTQYFQCQLVKPNRDRSEFVVGFKNIDEEKSKELTQQRKVESALAAVEKSNAVLQDEMDLAGALSKDYPDVVLLDFAADTSTVIKRSGKILAEDERRIRHSYRMLWADYIMKYVLDEDKANLRTAIAPQTVRNRLSAQDEYICSYRVSYDQTGIHHIQAAFIRMYSRRTAESQVILGFRNVDAIVEEEHRHLKIQEEQLRIINALSQEYHSLFKIHAARRTMSLYRTDGIGMAPELIGKLMAYGSYDQIISRYIDSFVAEEDCDRMRELTRLDVLLEQVPPVGLYKLGYRRRLGDVTAYYEMNVVRTVDENQQIIFIMGLRDVDSEMQRQLRQAREMEAQSEIIEGLGSEYYSVLLVDPHADAVTTYRAEDEDGKAIAAYFDRMDNCWSKGILSYAKELVSEGSRQEFIEKLSPERLRAGGEDYSLTYEKLGSKGITYLQARVAFVQEKDGGFAVVIGTRNIDDLIKKERKQEMALKEAFDAAEAASRAKTDFLSNMSHDIRTPMNGIIGMTAIAAAHIDDRERVQDCLQKITQASKHLLSLINEVLDMSKIESGKVDLIEEEFHLSDLIDNLLAMTNTQIEEHHHTLTVNISGVTHEDVIGDSLRIQKVFTNLMSNAVKYTPDGGEIRLTITEKPSHQTKVGCYEFVFEDNGIGMSEEFQKHIFEPFSRAMDSRVSKIQGTGLGMPISRNIARMMGGDIRVESTPGVGSRFTVTMYLKLQDAEEFRYDEFLDLSILVADDDPLCLESCCSILQDLGMQAEGVDTGEAVIKQVMLRHEQERDYFACIIDWKLPDMDGIAVTREVRRMVGADVPIIIISAYDWSDIEQEARAAGANAFISKPLFRSRLAKTFHTLMGNVDSGEQDTAFYGLENLHLNDYRVLLAEDNELNAEIASELLQMTGLSVEVAGDGIQAVDMVTACADGYYDLIFMDIQMPRMNGYDAARAIRAMDRSYCKKVPIIAMTANAFAEDVLAAKTVGMNEHIAKPLDLKTLAKALRRWLS